MVPDLSSPQEIRALASAMGPYGPIAIIATQFAQVIIAPIPPVTPVVSGLLYGLELGVIYSTIGAALGSLVAILLSRRYGRPIVQYFLAEEAIQKFDDLTSGAGMTPFIVLFVFPGFPDDTLCFIAGLTKLDWRKLFIAASLGRIPGIAMLAVTGNSIAEANLFKLITASTAIAAVSYLSVRYKDRLEEAATDIEKRGLKLVYKLSPYRETSGK